MQKTILLLLLTISFQLKAQFQFSGEVTTDFNNATAYLSIIDDYHKLDLFLTENIIQECKIDSLGNFSFKGDFLSTKNMIYQIHIDQCNNDVTDHKHLLNHCEQSETILFIANNTDTVFFPLNSLSQVFCDIEFSSNHNTAIFKITHLQEELLSNLQSSKSDSQRNLIYKNCFQKLQEFSQNFNDPLAELYAYYLYANTTSFSRESYLKDLKKSDYYGNLLEKLESTYPNKKYSTQFKKDLRTDNYSSASQSSNLTTYILIVLLIISVAVNIKLLQKNKRATPSKIDYSNLLTPQEQKVFELMHQKNTNKEVAESLFISVSTVKTHINNIYSKLGISSRKEVAQFFE